jgi:hypothetical protein
MIEEAGLPLNADVPRDVSLHVLNRSTHPSHVIPPCDHVKMVGHDNAGDHMYLAYGFSSFQCVEYAFGYCVDSERVHMSFLATNGDEPGI